MQIRPRSGITKTILFGSTAAVAALGLTSAAQGQAQQAPVSNTSSVSPAAETPDSDAIIVLGTRRLDRTLANSPSPVDVIGGNELQTQPAADMLDVVKNLVPSFFVGQNTISDASTFVRAPSLRGLPADEILVMINGKRFNRSALVQVVTGGDSALSQGSQGADISLIPSIAIDNLQVLREGATAQYGSDAIAGVLNYGLKSKAGFEVQGRFGKYYAGDGDSRQIAANAGVVIGDNVGFINLSGEYNDDKGTSRGATRPNAAFFALRNPTLAPQLPNFPGPVQIWGSSPAHGYKLMLNSGFDITDNVELYFVGNLAHSKANQSFNYRPVQSAIAADSNGVARTLGVNGAFAHPVYLTPCPVGSVTCAAGGFVRDANVYNFSTLYPAGFTPRFVGVKDQSYGVLGLKGDFMDIHYDASGSLSRNVLNLSMYSSLNASFGPQSQTSFEFGKLIQKEVNGNLDLSYDVDAGLASPITLAGGFEFRRETYKTTAGDLQSYAAGPYASQALYRQTSPGVYVFDSTVTMSPAASGYGGTSPEFAGSNSQTSYGVYLSAEADLTDTLSVGGAGRYEHYSTFGSAKVGKLNAIWKATPAISIRGTVGTGFHAPSPGQSNTQIVTTAFTAGNQVQTGTYPVTNVIAQFYGAVPLKPEKSTNFGLGLVLSPLTNFTLAIDGYNIKVKNRISVSDTFNVSAADVARLPVLATVGVGGDVNYFTNGFDTRTRGVDVVGTYRTEAFQNPLSLTLAYNYNKSKVTDFVPGTIGADRIDDISNYAPKHRGNVSASYTIAGFSITARENFYSAWSTEQDYPGDKFGSEFTSDIDVSYTIQEHYTLSVGATNIFNNYPDKISPSASNPIYPVTGSTADGQIYPRTGGPFGINGGFWYVRARIKY